MAEYPSAQDMFVDEQRTFIDALAGLPGDQLTIVVHKTGGTPSLQSLANYFQNDSSRASTHFGIDLDGTIGQFVLLKDGAGGNCCVETGYDQYWTPFVNQYGNLNRCTISLEHIDPTQDNSTPVPDAQRQASFRLIAWLCQKFNISANHIKTHASIDPINRARCPGNYPMPDLIAYIKNGGIMVPTGWTDVNNVLTAPNGVKVVHGFRDYVLSHNWDAANEPVMAEFGTSLLEASNPSLGGGSQQLFHWTMLGWNAARGVFFEWGVRELAFCRQQVQQKATQIQQLDAQIAQLKAELAAAPTPTVQGLDPTKVADRLTALGLLGKQREQLAAQPIS